VENESDEQNGIKKLTASPEIIAWKRTGSYHRDIIERERSKENKRLMREQKAKFESKILGLADIERKEDFYTRLEKEEESRKDNNYASELNQ
jgi:hypothetical protein